MVYGLATKLASAKTNKQTSTWQKNKTNTSATLFSYAGIDVIHKFSCTHDAVCMHVTYTVVTVHTLCENLTKRGFGNLIRMEKLRMYLFLRKIREAG